MAEALGVAAGVVGLGTFALESSIALYQTINSYKSHPQRVRELAEEANALSGVLGSLVETVQAAADLDLSVLEIPLQQCGNACKGFTEQIQKCSSRSTGSQRSVKDWVRLRYNGDDIDGFRRLLASHKLTVTIALTHATLRQSTITADGIEGYHELLERARGDLEERLERIDEKLDTMLQKSVTESSADATELRQIHEEKLSTEKSLEICTQLSNHISQLEVAAATNSGRSSSTDAAGSIPERITREGLEECKHSLTRMVEKLKTHEKLLFNQLTEKMKATTTSPDQAADIARLREEWKSMHESMSILSEAGNYFEQDTSVIENHATGDAVQIMVSTDEKTIRGTNRGLGWRSRQIGGRMDNETLRQISRDMVTITIRKPEDEEPRRGGTPTASDSTGRGGKYSEFKERYGEGFKLTSKFTSSTSTPSTGLGL